MFQNSDFWTSITWHESMMLYTHTEHQTRFENVVCQKSVLEICLDPFPVTLDPLFSPFNLFNTDFNISSQILELLNLKINPPSKNFAKENWPQKWPQSTRSILNWIIKMTWCWISYKMTSWWRHNFHISDALSKIVHKNDGVWSTGKVIFTLRTIIPIFIKKGWILTVKDLS